MRKFYTMLSACIFVVNSFAQGLYVTKRDFSNSPNYVYSLLELNKLTGAIIDTHNFPISFPNLHSPKSLVYDSSTNEIYGISGNIVVRYNITTKTETSFLLPSITSTDYGDIVIANGRLFVTKRDFSNSPNYVYSLLELNKLTGAIIDTYNFPISFPNLHSPESLAYDPSANEVYGISGNIIVKYNINSKTETSFLLPSITSTDYGDIVIANERLFVTKRDFSNSANYLYYFLELDKLTGSITDTYNFSTSFPNLHSPVSLVCDGSNEIYGISGNIISKYNITTKTETSFLLPSITSTDYGDIIITNSNGTGIAEVENASVRIYPNPVKDFLQIENDKSKINQIEVLDLSGKIIYQFNNLTDHIDVSTLSQGIYFVKVETEKGIVTKKFVKE